MKVYISSASGGWGSKWRKALGSFPQKVNTWYEEYAGGMHDAAAALSKGDTYTEYDSDLNYVIDAVDEARKIINYYHKSVEPRVAKFVEEYAQTHGEQEEYFKVDKLNDTLDDLQWMAKQNVNNLDFKVLKNRY